MALSFPQLAYAPPKPAVVRFALGESGIVRSIVVGRPLWWGVVVFARG
jgi:hypothetical protein